jgi:hypothetical protein
MILGDARYKKGCRAPIVGEWRTRRINKLFI